jgi:hypothetical protein
LQSTRRRFLKQVGLSGIGALALPLVLPSRVLGAGGANNRLNIAIIGCGGRSRQLMPWIFESGENIVALCDVDTRQFSASKQEAAKHGPAGASVQKARLYQDYRKLLEAEKAADAVDAVVIATGQRWHVPLCKAALGAGKHVYCEKALAHSVAQAREIGQVTQGCKLATQVGSHGGAADTFRRAMEVIQAGLLGQIREVHCWITRGFGPSESLAQVADPIPPELNWDFWCGPSRLLPFKNYYLGDGVNWGHWLEFGDGHLADMGAHGLNLPWRALKLGGPTRVSVEIPEVLKDSYPSATKFRWDYPARGDLAPVALWWHDGGNAAPPVQLGAELLATYHNVPNDGVLFVGEKGLLLSGAWGTGGVVKLNGEARFRGVLDHEAAKPIPVTLPRARNQNNMLEWTDACKGLTTTFQSFPTASCVAEIAMTGIVALRFGRLIDWDNEAMKVVGAPEADALVHRPMRRKWL